LTKRRSTTPAPSSYPPPSVPPRRSHTTTARTSTTTASKRLHINFPHLFRMHPWQRAHAYSDDAPPEFGEAVHLEGFEWPLIGDEAKEQMVVAVQDGVRDLANHIGNKILEDFDVDASSSSSSSSSGSDHDSESECSDVTVTHSSHASSSTCSPASSASAFAQEVTALSPPWWHYSLRRKVYSYEEDDSETRIIPFPYSFSSSSASSTTASTLHESVGKWPDQDGEGFVF